MKRRLLARLRPTRFERKILVALAVVALGSMAGALLLVGSAVREAYRTGVSASFAEELASGAEAHRENLLLLRALTRLRADRVGEDDALEDALAQGDLETARARLHELGEDDPRLEKVAIDDRVLVTFERERDEGEYREVIERREVGEAEVALHFAVPESIFEDYQRAGETAELYARLLDRQDFVSDTYVAAYSAAVILIAFLAGYAGVFLSRRVTDRVRALVHATRRVGAGDLTVRVPVQSDDEVAELSQSFNDMVRDIADSRARVEYLQRIGGWQEFARRLAHEIKNPLTPIQLAAQEMRDSYDGEDERYRARLEDATAIIQEEVATLRRLVSEFTDFSRLPKVQGEPADLRDFLLEIARSVPPLLVDLGAKDAVHVDVAIPESSIPVEIDSMMLKRAIDNLVRNAVQAVLGSERGTGHVWVTATHDEESVTIEVRDDGPGLSPDELERVFDPYFTKKREGTGLGLPIVKKIVFEHDGSVHAEPSPEGGARFVLRLPVSRARLA
ncbi:MAG: HAMP domain-containing protein [Myxococcales bacterium]|nr:HAMP domain-containing protein [Myxococcales bacterium]